MDISSVTQGMSVFIQLATVVTLIYALYKFARKPNDTQNDRLKALEDWKKEVDRRLDHGQTHFEDIDKGNRVTQEAILALIDHAIDNNHTDKLIEAKDNLQKYLINK